MRDKNLLPLKEKVNILNRLEHGEIATKLAKEYRVSKSTISLIKKKKENILKWASNEYGNKLTLRASNFPKMENSLYRWILTQRDTGHTINNLMIKAKAIELHNKIKENENNFVASDGWLCRFKKRNGLGFSQISADKLRSHPDLMVPFEAQLQAKMNEQCLCLEQIYFADESQLFWKAPEEMYVSSNEEISTGTKSDNQMITFLCCANANGESKLNMLTIAETEQSRDLENLKPLVEHKSSPTARMTAAIFKDWFHNSFIPQVKADLTNQGLPERALLLIDNIPSYPDEIELMSEDGLIAAMFLPSHITSLIEAMDQNASKITKQLYRNILLAEHTSKQHDLKKITLQDAISLLHSAWSRVSAQSLSDRWNTIETIASDDEFQKNKPLEISNKNLNGNVRNVVETTTEHAIIAETQVECSKENIDKWNEEIDITDPLFETDIKKENDSSSDETRTSLQKIKAEDVAEALNMVIEWAEDEHINKNVINALWNLREKAVGIAVSKKTTNTK